MHAYTLFLIGAWILGSGLVAYVCDNLGRKLGKKRLSLWGMRPRHTAMLFTVLTGIGIAAVTVGLVALTVPDAQVALFQVKQIRQQLEELNHTQESLEKRNRRLLLKNNELEQLALTSETRAKGSERRADLARVGLKQVETQRNEARRAFQTAKFRLGRLEFSRDRLVKQVLARQKRLASLARLLNSSQKDLSEAKEAVRLARNDQAIARKDQSKARDDQMKTQKEAENAKAQVASLQQEIKDETQKLAALNKTLALVSQDLGRTQRDLEDRRKELAATRAGYALSNYVFRRAQMTYTTGQEIARRVIYHPTDKDEVNLQIVKLLDTANTEALERGADHPQPGYRAVQLAPHTFVDAEGKQKTLEESELILEFAQFMIKDKKDVVIRLVAAGNSFKGELVQANLEVTPNELVFERGDLIAKHQIDGRMSEAKIMESLIALLQTKVRLAAIEQGMLPSSAGALGDINWDQMLEAVHEISASGKMTEVQIVAFADAWTADPLTVRFLLPT